MAQHGIAFTSLTQKIEEQMDLRRGPWTIDEDLMLMKYIAKHGEGRWNSLARCAGLKRTGKSCRLRWLNYLRPDIRRGNISPEEQYLILDLHSRWGNRWSKIAQHLPGRTDNEIKNYWRTRVQKHAKQLKCDVSSKQFQDVMRYVWMPRLMERICAASGKLSTGCGEFETGLERSGGVRDGSIGLTLREFSEPESVSWVPVGHSHEHGSENFDRYWAGEVCEKMWSMEDIWQLAQQT